MCGFVALYSANDVTYMPHSCLIVDTDAFNTHLPNMITKIQHFILLFQSNDQDSNNTY